MPEHSFRCSASVVLRHVLPLKVLQKHAFVPDMLTLIVRKYTSKSHFVGKNMDSYQI